MADLRILVFLLAVMLLMATADGSRGWERDPHGPRGVLVFVPTDGGEPEYRFVR